MARLRWESDRSGATAGRSSTRSARPASGAPPRPSATPPASTTYVRPSRTRYRRSGRIWPAARGDHRHGRWHTALPRTAGGSRMKVLATFARLYVAELDPALDMLASLLDERPANRFSYGELELATVGSVLVIAGPDEALRPYRD